MFLFKKKKESPEIKVDAAKTEVKKVAAPPVKVVDKSAKPSNNDKSAKSAPVRLVVPPGSTGATKAQNPDEIADSLLVKVEPNPAIENAVDDAIVEAVLKPIIVPVAAPAVAQPVIVARPGPAGTKLPAVAASIFTTEAPRADQAAKPAETAEKKPAENGKKAAEAEDKGNMFSNLFGKAEVEEETYLDRLIKSLPDVSIEEVVNEADEVKNIMNEWFLSQNAKGNATPGQG
jgi:hypothetical protein